MLRLVASPAAGAEAYLVAEDRRPELSFTLEARNDVGPPKIVDCIEPTVFGPGRDAAVGLMKLIAASIYTSLAVVLGDQLRLEAERVIAAAPAVKSET